MHILIRQATPQDAARVSMVLQEAAAWLMELGITLWRSDEVSAQSVREDIAAGLFFLAEDAGEPVGTLKFQLEDPVFWPDIPPGDSTFVHRLAVRRRYSGGIVSSQILDWAIDRTSQLGRPFLRLDCDAARPRLRAVYERFGFTHHSDRQVGPYYVARYQYAIPQSPTA